MSLSDESAPDGVAERQANGRPDESKPPSRAPLAAGLYVTATPIGNARDLTLRALDVLAGVQAIAAEDTRVTARLLGLHGIKTKLVSYRAENAARATPALLARLARGEAVALVTDAGTPHVSDPGAELVAAAAEAGHAIFAVPGASALTAALSISGLAAKRTLFAGFLPAGAADRRAELAALKSIDAALVLFEAPHRICDAMADMADILGPRPAALCREMTKRFEEVRRGRLDGLAADLKDGTIAVRGEFVLVVAPPESADAVQDAGDLDAALTAALKTMRVKDAADAVAGALGLPRRAVYARALTLKDDG